MTDKIDRWQVTEFMPPSYFLINNGTGVPTTNQFSAGIRQRFGMWGVSAAWAGAWSRNGFTKWGFPLELMSGISEPV